jgi:hypothetical protein
MHRGRQIGMVSCVGVPCPKWEVSSMRTGLLRVVSVALCAMCAVVYFAIGMGLIYEQRPGGMRLWVFGFSAAIAFAAGVVLLVARPGRFVWMIGSAFMVLVIVAYVVVAPSRQPNFEIWGISLKLAQAVTLVALLGLLAHDRQTRSA